MPCPGRTTSGASLAGFALVKAVVSVKVEASWKRGNAVLVSEDAWLALQEAGLRIRFWKVSPALGLHAQYVRYHLSWESGVDMFLRGVP